jgi:hypothetical protein
MLLRRAWRGFACALVAGLGMESVRATRQLFVSDSNRGGWRAGSRGPGDETTLLVAFPKARSFSFWSVLANNPVVPFTGFSWLMHPDPPPQEFPAATAPSCTVAILHGVAGRPEWDAMGTEGLGFQPFGVRVRVSGPEAELDAAAAWRRCALSTRLCESVLRIRLSSASKLRNLLSVA